MVQFFSYDGKDKTLKFVIQPEPDFAVYWPYTYNTNGVPSFEKANEYLQKGELDRFLDEIFRKEEWLPLPVQYAEVVGIGQKAPSHFRLFVAQVNVITEDGLQEITIPQGVLIVGRYLITPMPGYWYVQSENGIEVRTYPEGATILQGNAGIQIVAL